MRRADERRASEQCARSWRSTCRDACACDERSLMKRTDQNDTRRADSGKPGGGAGRRDEVGPSGVYPMSGGIPQGKHPELRTPAAWGQGDRGAAGYDDAGGSELVMRDGQLLGGTTAGPNGEPTIDIHGETCRTGLQRGKMPPHTRPRT